MSNPSRDQQSFDFSPLAGLDPMDELDKKDDHTKTLKLLQKASSSGWIREIDYSLAAFLYGLNPVASSSTLIITTALLSYAESLGHTCLSIDQLLDQGLAFFGLSSALKTYPALSSRLPIDKTLYRDELLKSPLVRFESLGGVGRDNAPSLPIDQGQPLVLCQRGGELLLYLRRHWQSESYIAKTVVEKCQQLLPVDEQKTAELLEMLFPTPNCDPLGLDVDWQKISCALALRSAFTLITGGPGTGKTYTVSRLIALILALNGSEARQKIALVAPTGKAASRLYRSIQNSLLDLGAKLKAQDDIVEKFERIGVAKTLHSLLGARKGSRSYRFHEGNRLDLDLLFIDESSMISIELMSALLRALRPQTQLVLLGDKNQLSSVEAGSVFGELCEAQVSESFKGSVQHEPPCSYGQEVKDYLDRVSSSGAPLASTFLSGDNLIRDHMVKLQRSHRFTGPIAQLSSAVNDGDVKEALRVIRADTTLAVSLCTSEDVESILAIALKGRRLNLSAGEEVAAHFKKYWDLIDMAYKNGLFETDPRPSFTRAVSGRILSPLDNREAFHDKQLACIKGILSTFDQFRILCAVNEGPMGAVAINVAVEVALKSRGLIHDSTLWYTGKAIMLTRNQPELELSNGDVGLVLPSIGSESTEHRLKAYFLAADGVQSVALNRLDGVQTAYAMSIHKSQGSEFDHALLVLPQNMDQSLSRELLYTGITRSKTCLTIVQAQAGLIDKAIAKKTDRESALIARISGLSKLEGGG
jgi:exodeoxyribonuclease V alpha subunit